MSAYEVEHIGPHTLYRGDCRQIAASLCDVQGLITDPPYPDIEKAFCVTPIDVLDCFSCRQCVFWSPVEPFPLSWTAIHIWHKPNGQSSYYYERVFERHGTRVCRVWRQAAILPNYTQYRQECVPHPTQKPLGLLLHLVQHYTQPSMRVLDPFMGSGTTGVACIQLGRVFVGIEIDRAFFDIACQRMHDAMAQPDLFIAKGGGSTQQTLFRSTRRAQRKNT